VLTTPLVPVVVPLVPLVPLLPVPLVPLVPLVLLIGGELTPPPPQAASTHAAANAVRSAPRAQGGRREGTLLGHDWTPRCLVDEWMPDYLPCVPPSRPPISDVTGASRFEPEPRS
jgi:hypothetical protein